ncbi:MAG TPA: TonB family protein [Myxococcaceae bacterium]|nr:TonB family protein [Myxococcaceae bacterium]
MTPGAEDRAGQEQASRGPASRAPGGGGRLGGALGFSLVLHGLVALALWQGAAEPERVAPRPPEALEVELVWRRAAGRGAGASGPAAPERSAEPVKPPPRRRAPRAVSRPEPAAPDEPAQPEPAPRLVVPGLLPVLGMRSSALETVDGAAASEGGAGGGEAGGGASGASGASGAGGEAELQAYREGLSRQVGRQRRYPARAVRLRQEGTARVRERLHRDGSLAGPPRLEGSSRFRVLDLEALRMVEAAAPFAPLPASLPQEPVEFVIPVSFSLRAAAG